MRNKPTYKPNCRRSRGSRVLGSMEPDRNTFDVLDMPPNGYRRRKYRRSKNMLKEFSSCDEKIYPTVDLTCGDYSKFVNNQF